MLFCAVAGRVLSQFLLIFLNILNGFEWPGDKAMSSCQPFVECCRFFLTSLRTNSRNVHRMDVFFATARSNIWTKFARQTLDINVRQLLVALSPGYLSVWQELFPGDSFLLWKHILHQFLFHDFYQFLLRKTEPCFSKRLNTFSYMYLS